MPRLPRIQVKGAIHYVIANGSEGEPIFKDKDDYKMYLELVSKYKSQHKFKLYSYNMLPERVELLVETGDDASISEIMHDLNSLYTKYFNGRYQKRGHLFESRFRSVLIEKANYLLNVTRHIHLSGTENPYSSFHIYTASQNVIASVAKQSNPSGQIASSPTAPRNDSEGLNISEEVQEVLSFLKNKGDANAYELYVLKGEKEEIATLEKSLRRGSVLGSDGFQEQVKEELQRRAEQQKEEARPARPNRVVIAMVGAMVLLATTSSVYLFVSKQRLAGQYEQLMSLKEGEFNERAKFENRSPLTPMDLEGTAWEVETVPMPRGGVIQKDTLSFKDGRFESKLMAGKGFRASSYILIPRGQGLFSWQAAQSTPEGETVSWQGTWQGEAMKGTYILRQVDGAPQGFSFFSVRWSS